MGLEKITLYKDGQTTITNPYYETHKDKIKVAEKIEDFEANSDMVHLDPTEIQKYYSIDNMIAESNYRSENNIPKETPITAKQASEHIYIHKNIREDMKTLMTEFNKRLKEVGYEETL